MDELEKCKNNIQYFAETYIDIPLQEHEKYAVDYIKDNNFNTIASPKNDVINSTLILHKLLFTDNTISIISKTWNESMKNLNNVKILYEKIPDFIKSNIKEIKKNCITFDNGSKFIVNHINAIDSIQKLNPNFIIFD